MPKKNSGEIEGKETRIVESSSQVVAVALDIPSFYSNNTRVSFSDHDVRFVFSEYLPAVITDASPNQGTEVQINTPRVTVVMSHHHAKRFLDLMSRVVKENSENKRLMSVYFPDSDSN